MNHRTRVVVRRGSHVQYAPQMGLAHSGPVTRVMVVKTTPISAEATAIRLYDRIAVASAEIGVVFTPITLVTGPLWAKPIWGAYWTWDPRLTTTLVLWFIYVAYLMVRSSFPEGHRRARLLAVVGIVGWVDVPIVFMSIRWWRTIHPTLVSAQGMDMDPSMQAMLVFSLGVFTMLYVYLMVVRVGQETVASRLGRISQQIHIR